MWLILFAWIDLNNWFFNWSHLFLFFFNWKKKNNLFEGDTCAYVFRKEEKQRQTVRSNRVRSCAHNKTRQRSVTRRNVYIYGFWMFSLHNYREKKNKEREREKNTPWNRIFVVIKDFQKWEKKQDTHLTWHIHRQEAEEQKKESQSVESIDLFNMFFSIHPQALLYKHKRNKCFLHMEQKDWN